MTEMLRMIAEQDGSQTAALGGSVHTAILATPEEAKKNQFNLRNFSSERYLKNPVVLHQHGWGQQVGDMPIGKTNRLYFDGSGNLVADFQFYGGEPAVDRIAAMWRDGVLRGASLGWHNTNEGAANYRSEIHEWSVVAIPRDKGALKVADVSGREHSDDNAVQRKEDDMTKDEVAEMIKSAMGGDKPDEAKLAAVFSEKLEAAFAARDKETEKKAKAENEAKQAVADVHAMADKRAVLLFKAGNMLPKDFVPSGKTNREILIAALGDSVSNADKRSEDYLEASLDWVAKNRETAKQVKPKADDVSVSVVGAGDALSIRQMMEGS